jgi:hypothetical protein
MTQKKKQTSAGSGYSEFTEMKRLKNGRHEIMACNKTWKNIYREIQTKLGREHTEKKTHI